MSTLIINSVARSIKFWGSYQAEKVPVAVFPLTAYNAMGNDNIYAGRLGPHNPTRAIITDIVAIMLHAWQRSVDGLHIQQLRWALTNIDSDLHSAILATLISLSTTTRIPMKPNTSSLPADILSKLNMALASLEQALIEKDPLIPRHLQASHQLLISYPESVALLEDAEIATLIGAAQLHSGIEIVKAAAAKGGSRKKITADDL